MGHLTTSTTKLICMILRSSSALFTTVSDVVFPIAWPVLLASPPERYTRGGLVCMVIVLARGGERQLNYGTTACRHIFDE